MSEENKAVVRRCIDELWNKLEVDVLNEIATDDFVQHEHGKDRNLEAYQQAYSSVRTAFPDSHFGVEDMIAAEDKVAVRWTWRGRQTGSWGGLEPTGKQVTIPGITIFRLVGSRIAELWSAWDTAPLR